MHIRTTYSSHTAHSAVTGCSLTVPTLAPQDSPGLAIDEELEHQDAMALDAARWSTKVCWPLAGQVRCRSRPLWRRSTRPVRPYLQCLCRPKRQVPDSSFDAVRQGEHLPPMLNQSIGGRCSLYVFVGSSDFHVHHRAGSNLEM